ncbi:hypothetical protein HUU40_28400, partial [candidate division KSB1 bacterium]|nr:hypothetical protein [candidate division KSB1 bacterium]
MGKSTRVIILPFILLLHFIVPAVLHAQLASAPLGIVKLPETGEVEFVALGELADLLGLRTFYSEKARKVIVYVGNAEVKVTAMNPFVQVDDRT